MEDVKLKQIHIKLAGSTHYALKLEAAICNVTVQEFVVNLIEERISKRNLSTLIKDGDLKDE